MKKTPKTKKNKFSPYTAIISVLCAALAVFVLCGYISLTVSILLVYRFSMTELEYSVTD